MQERYSAKPKAICRIYDDFEPSRTVLDTASMEIHPDIKGRNRTLACARRNERIANAIQAQLYGDRPVSDPVRTDLWLKACALADKLHPEDKDF